VTWARAQALVEQYAGLFRVVPCKDEPGYHLAANHPDEGTSLCGAGADIGEYAWRDRFACCADVRLRSGCNQDTALTVGDLRICWASLDDRSPILVAHLASQADWAQRADVIAAEGGLVVARLFAPWAKQAQPAPGTVWAPATTINGRRPDDRDGDDDEM